MVESLEEKVAAHRTELNRLTQNLFDRSAEVIHTVHKVSKQEAVVRVAQILEMEGTLTAQQFRRLSKDVAYATGDHSYAATRLSILPVPISTHHAAQEHADKNETEAPAVVEANSPQAPGAATAQSHGPEFDTSSAVLSGRPATARSSGTKSGSSSRPSVPRSAHSPMGSKPRTAQSPHESAPSVWTGAENRVELVEDEAEVMEALRERLPLLATEIGEDGKAAPHDKAHEGGGELLGVPTELWERVARKTGSNADTDIYGAGDAGKQLRRHAILGTHTNDAG
eukprot:1992737-Rhodomonas_salina.1